VEFLAATLELKNRLNVTAANLRFAEVSRNRQSNLGAFWIGRDPRARRQH
jgi:hypothetical protein